MPDLGAKMTDDRVDEITERLRGVYAEAAKDLRDKMNQYTKRFEAKDREKRSALQAGKITAEEYRNWQSGQVFIGKQWQSKVDQMARSMVGAEENAVRIVREGQMDGFADNANYFEYRIDRDFGFGMNFSLYDSSTVARLVSEQPELMPRRVVDGEKCEAWNVKIISNCITQGIIQGESIPQIARRMARDTASTDMKAMTRYARTAMTGAQNAGRIQAMRDSKKMGIRVLKLWISAGDERVRPAHDDLDGQEQEVEKPFENDLGEIMYPGDPNASDENIWNCRCALGYEYPESGVSSDDYTESDEEAAEFEEWEESSQKEPEHIVAQGKDISGTWERRESEFDFEIEDVIAAQGFDGLPQVVDRETFDRIVAESGFIAQRTYSAPDQETLDAYRDQLYHGKWYVDCSTGGAQYGQGMYSAANYQGVLSEGIKQEMAHYREFTQQRIIRNMGEGVNPVSYTETFTLMPDAKIITYDELNKLIGGYTTSEEEKKIKVDTLIELTKDLPEEVAIYYRGQMGLYEYGTEEYKRYDQIWDKFSELPKEERHEMHEDYRTIFTEYTETYKERIDTLKEERREMSEKLRRFEDEGSAAASLGYDAINAEGHGKSDSYTVVVNRTKCVFLEDDYED